MKTIFLMLCSALLCLHATANPTSDYIALRALYLSTDGDNWTNNTGWPDAATFNANPNMPSGTDMSTWYGIGVDGSGCVNFVDMSGNWGCSGWNPANGNNLVGSIPPELGSLTNLEGLLLPGNQLSGSIPGELGNLSNLTYLYLFNNQLSGCFDNNLFNLCGQLRSCGACYTEQCSFQYDGYCAVNMGNNLPELAGPGQTGFCAIYQEGFGACDIYNADRYNDSLALIALYNATDGANWTTIWDINQPMNSWSGVNLNLLGRVNELNLGNHQLNGPLPNQLGNLTNLKYLNLSNNQLTGVIPPQFGNFTELGELYLNNNQLTGSIPPGLGNSKLQTLNLSYNQLTGSIPPELANYPIAVRNSGFFIGWYMYLNNNQLTGNIPQEFANTIPLEFNVSSNRLTGSIPSFTRPGSTCSGPDDYWFDDYYSYVGGPLNYAENDFSFDDIAAFSQPPPYGYYISPQYHGDVQYYTEDAGSTLTLGLSYPLPGNNNMNVTYQWKLDGVDIPGATNPTYSITNLQPGSIGEYTLCMRDATRTPPYFAVISRPIYVNICIPTLSLMDNVSGVYHAGFDLLSDGKVVSGSTASFKAGQMITLQPGFEAELQSELSCEIEECGN